MADTQSASGASPGVVLSTRGGADAPPASAVRRYLREFLWDPRVVQIPRPLWFLILHFLILPFRPRKTAKKYAAIWREDGSPLRIYHERQAQLLRGSLGQRLKKALPVVAAMRYGKPSIAAGLKELKARECDRILVIPMYPQYAGSTTGSATDALAKGLRKWRPAPAIKGINDFHAHPAYAKAIAKNVNDYWTKHGRPDRLLISFHGIPRAVVEAGDPYEAQCLESARLIAAELGWMDQRTRVTFQSRFGAAEWLKPYTAATLETLARDGVGRVDVICPGFAADCLETLEEIALEGKATFIGAGGKEFHYIPTTNDTPAWMTALSIIAMENL